MKFLFKFSSLIIVLVFVFMVRGTSTAQTRETGPAIVIPIDANTTYQKIDGFGFFGGIGGIWTSEKAGDFYNDAWLDMVIDDMGLTIWRDELYPHYPDPRVNTNPERTDKQDCWWDKKKPIVQAIYNKAKASGVDLKVILTVWSPPAELKCYQETKGEWHSPTGIIDESKPNPGLTKKGGALKPSAYREYAEWLVDGIRMYKKAGIPVYAISPQNEPNFYEPYNSCQYTEQMYTDMLKAITPVIKAEFPDIKIFGCEHMAQHEANGWSTYHRTIMQDPIALNDLDIWAYHGYTDGVNASGASNTPQIWDNIHTMLQDTGKPVWMTEFSDGGAKYFSEDIDGALNLAHAIYSALYHGHVSAWVWWQGSNRLAEGIDGYTLTADTLTGYKYAASKHYYRFIRPGAKMIKAVSPANELFVSAYRNTDGQIAIVLINISDQPVSLKLDNATLPSGEYSVYRTSSKELCQKVETLNIKNRIHIMGKCIYTLTSGDAP